MGVKVNSEDGETTPVFRFLVWHLGGRRRPSGDRRLRPREGRPGSSEAPPEAFFFPRHGAALGRPRPGRTGAPTGWAPLTEVSPIPSRSLVHPGEGRAGRGLPAGTPVAPNYRMDPSAGSGFRPSVRRRSPAAGYAGAGPPPSPQAMADNGASEGNGSVGVDCG